MSKDLHPSLLEHYISANHRAALASWGLTALSWGLLSLGCMSKSVPARIGFLGGALAACAIARPIRSVAVSTERTRSDFQDISTQSLQNWLYARMKPDQAAVELYQEPQAQEELEPYEFDSILDEAVGIALFGNSGSGKSSVAKHIIGLMGDTQILVLDPHDDGQTWDGLPVISDYDAIVEQLGLLLQELDSRRQLRKQKQKLEPLVVVCDEFPSVRDYCKQIGSKVADRFILRFGSECRKYEMLALFCSQSGNTKALGLDGQGDFLENYLLIRLCKVATKYAKNLSDRTVLQRLKQAGFPCLVGDEVSIHPTHGHYPKFAKILPPKGLKTLRSLPLSIPLAKGVAYRPLEVGSKVQNTTTESQPTTTSPQPDHNIPTTPSQPPIEPQDYHNWLEGIYRNSPGDSVVDSTTPSQPTKPPQNPENQPPPQSCDDVVMEYPEIDELSDEELRSLILEFRGCGINGQLSFIKAMWDLSPGGNNPRYDAAVKRYRKVCQRFGL